MARIVLTSVSIDDYLAMRGYFEEIAAVARAVHERAPSEQSETVRDVITRFIVSIEGLLGNRRGEAAAQIRAAREAGRTHCDLTVETDTTLDLTRSLLDLLRALEELRLRGGATVPSPPPGIRAFILACQAALEDETMADAARRDTRRKPEVPRHSSPRPPRAPR